MTHTKYLAIAGLGVRKIVFHSKLARFIGGPTNNVGISKGTILVAGTKINQLTLAHEWGHTVTAGKRGWLYLPWIIGRFVSQGYAHSKAEREADEWAWNHLHLFPAEVRCDCAE